MSDRYDHFAHALATGDPTDASHVKPLVDNLKIALCDSGYVANIGAHQFRSSIPDGNVIGTTPNISGVTVSAAGVVTGDTETITGVTAGRVATQLVLFKDTGDPTTSPLMIWNNAASVLPLTTSGSDIDIAPDPGPYHLYSL